MNGFLKGGNLCNGEMPTVVASRNSCIGLQVAFRKSFWMVPTACRTSSIIGNFFHEKVLQTLKYIQYLLVTDTLGSLFSFALPLNDTAESFALPLNKTVKSFALPLNETLESFALLLNNMAESFALPLNRGGQSYFEK
jgi:hypothetical protein